jgi:hypothetical protein
MKIHYCDFCRNVLKENKTVLKIYQEENIEPSQSYHNSYDHKTETYELCESCLILIREIFKYKKEKVHLLETIVDHMYNAPYKTKGKRNGKKGN